MSGGEDPGWTMALNTRAVEQWAQRVVEEASKGTQHTGEELARQLKALQGRGPRVRISTDDLRGIEHWAGWAARASTPDAYSRVEVDAGELAQTAAVLMHALWTAYGPVGKPGDQLGVMDQATRNTQQGPRPPMLCGGPAQDEDGKARICVRDEAHDGHHADLCGNWSACTAQVFARRCWLPAGHDDTWHQDAHGDLARRGGATSPPRRVQPVDDAVEAAAAARVKDREDREDFGPAVDQRIAELALPLAARRPRRYRVTRHNGQVADVSAAGVDEVDGALRFREHDGTHFRTFAPGAWADYWHDDEESTP